MSAYALPNKWRAWLRRCALSVASVLREQVHDRRVVVHPDKDLIAFDGWNGDWAISLARLKSDGGNSFDVWVDEYPNVGRPIFSVCYRTASARRIKELATLRFGSLGPTVWKDDRAIGTARDGAYSMASALPSAEFGRPIAEIYEDNPYSFYTLYLSDRLDPSRRPPTRMVKAGAGHIISMVRAAQALSRVKRASLADAYPAFRNRGRVAAHIRRERSSAQAEAAKQRDKYTCVVCRVNFADLYGALGDGFAEAHHMVPLASLQSTGSTEIDDLRTVCAGCHRMLHLMKGDRDDIKRLRVLFAGNWPKVRGVVA